MLRNYKRLEEYQLREIKKILIIQQKPFGDILLNTGYLPALRKHFPDAEIDYLIQRPYLTILEDNPHLDNLIIMEKPKGRGLKYILPQVRAAISVRKRRYDLIIDQLRGTSSARIIWFSGAKYRLGWIKKKWNFLYNVRIPQAQIRYKSFYKFDLLAPLGIQVKDHNLAYQIRKESIEYIKNWIHAAGLEHQEMIVFSPGSPVKRKQWDLDRYAQLGDKIQNNTDFKIILLWGPEEKKDSEYIKTKMNTPAIMAPPTTFNEAGALLNFTKVLITNDGGINHLAVSQNTPAISIFGSKSSPLKWCAWHRKEYLYLKDWDFKNRNDNSFNISSDQVFEKFCELLKILADDNSASIAKTF
jgi:ADP-heptose:LPS heptosyltransferase